MMQFTKLTLSTFRFKLQQYVFGVDFNYFWHIKILVFRVWTCEKMRDNSVCTISVMIKTWSRERVYSDSRSFMQQHALKWLNFSWIFDIMFKSSLWHLMLTTWKLTRVLVATAVHSTECPDASWTCSCTTKWFACQRGNVLGTWTAIESLAEKTAPVERWDDWKWSERHGT